MKIIAVEEHFVTGEVLAGWARLDPMYHDASVGMLTRDSEAGCRLEDFSDTHIRNMDASGIDVQVLSLTAPRVQNLEAADAVDLTALCGGRA